VGSSCTAPVDVRTRRINPRLAVAEPQPTQVR